MFGSGWSPTAHLLSSVSSYSNVIAQTLNTSVCLFAVQILCICQGQIQILLCPQSHDLLFLGVSISLSLFHNIHFYIWHHCPSTICVCGTSFFFYSSSSLNSFLMGLCNFPLTLPVCLTWCQVQHWLSLNSFWCTHWYNTALWSARVPIFSATDIESFM